MFSSKYNNIILKTFYLTGFWDVWDHHIFYHLIDEKKITLVNSGFLWGDGITGIFSFLHDIFLNCFNFVKMGMIFLYIQREKDSSGLKGTRILA